MENFNKILPLTHLNLKNHLKKIENFSCKEIKEYINENDDIEYHYKVKVPYATYTRDNNTYHYNIPYDVPDDLYDNKGNLAIYRGKEKEERKIYQLEIELDAISKKSVFMNKRKRRNFSNFRYDYYIRGVRKYIDGIFNFDKLIPLKYIKLYN
ncbi:hypothetical protein GVAV_002382 [Gurleya vavrai]